MNEHPYRASAVKEPQKMSDKEFSYRQTRVAFICACIAFIALVISVTTCNMRSDVMELKVLRERNMTCLCGK